jgi:hypothetical protein
LEFAVACVVGQISNIQFLSHMGLLGKQDATRSRRSRSHGHKLSPQAQASDGGTRKHASRPERATDLTK